MNKLFLTFMLVLSVSTSSFAGVINFDDLDSTQYGNYSDLALAGETASIGQGFQVTSLNGWQIVISEAYNSEWAAGVASSPNTMGIQNTLYIERTDGGIFDFNGAFFTTVYPNISGILNVELEGFNASSSIFNTDFNALNNFEAFNWTGIDKLRITNTGSDWLAMDNFTYNAEISAVPVPAAVWLFGSALAGFAGFSRFKKKT